MRVNPLVLAVLCITALAGLSRPARADTGLAMRCDGATAATQAAACTSSRTWVHPGPGDAVLSYPSVATDSTTVSWNDTALQFRPWVSILGNYGVMTCTKDIAAAQATIAAVGGIDACAPGGDAVAKVYVAASAVPLTPTVPPVMLVDATAHLSWTAPTQNADGSALTDLAGYNLYDGAIQVAGPVTDTQYVITGLAAGLHQFSVTAVNKGKLESGRLLFPSAMVTKDVTPSRPGVPGNAKLSVTFSQ